MMDSKRRSWIHKKRESVQDDPLSPIPSSPKRWSLTLLQGQQGHPTNSTIGHPLERTASAQTSIKISDVSKTGSFGKMSFSSMMGGLSGLSLSRTNTKDSTASNADDSRGRSMSIMKRARSSSHAPASQTEPPSRSQSRARSQSPFSFRRFRSSSLRETSPEPPLPLASSSSEVDLTPSPNIRPRTTAFTDDPDDNSGDETETVDGDYTEDELNWSDDDTFDPVTEANTERNALIELPGGGALGLLDGDDPDPLGEGVNVVVPPEPYFPTTEHSMGTSTRSTGGSSGNKRNPRRRKSTRHHEPLPLHTSRPIFQRDRCTITVTQGDPEGKLAPGRKKKRYVVASDLSEESRYAVEWGIGTVLRDGDEMLIVTIMENESKVDPPSPNTVDRSTKLRCQQERQGLSYILVRQATSLLQRTKLNVKISCQAWHAKNSRHMLLDIVDYQEPAMLIVGSRGLGQLKGILLGSTSHYLIQKCSVPVMVARRRLKRPPRKSAHLATHRTHVSLAEAGIDRVAAKVDEDVKVMRDAIQRDDEKRGGPGGAAEAAAEAALEREAQRGGIDEEGEDDAEGEADDDHGIKAGETETT